MGLLSRSGKRTSDVVKWYDSADDASGGSDVVEGGVVSRVKNVSSHGRQWFYDVIVGRYRRRKADKVAAGKIGDHDSHRFVMSLKPRSSYVFKSEYFVVDGKRVGCVLGFTHNDGARDVFDSFWGVYRLPYHLSEKVQVVLLEQAVVMDKAWVSRHRSSADRLAAIDDNASGDGRDRKKRLRASKRSEDLTVIGHELEDGASYVNVHARLVLYAPDLETLDEAILDIEHSYSDASRIPSIGVQAYMGDQRGELASLFMPCTSKRGKGWFFTSTEYAGVYHMVGRGVVDDNGLYMGVMVGDVNNSAVLLDVNGFSSHVVIGDSRFFGTSSSRRVELRPRVSDMLALKIAQGVLFDGGRTIHVVLNGCNIRTMVGGLDDETVVIDGFSTNVNPLEIFGEREDSLHLFEAQVARVSALVKQIHGVSDNDWTLIEGKISQILTDFYVDNGMWVKNAKDQLSRVRLVGIPHKDVPKMSMFMAYLRKEKQKLNRSGSRDAQEFRVLNVLISVFEKLLDANGDLFDVVSDNSVDGVKGARRVILDVSELAKRSTPVMMAQLVNVLGLGLWGSGRKDVLFFHGVNVLNSEVKPFIRAMVERLTNQGVRTVFSYDVLSSGDYGTGALEDYDFNSLEKASYTLFGQMSTRELNLYSEVTQKSVPAGLRSFCVDESNSGSSVHQQRIFLHRGMDNVVFALDFSLGPHFKQYMDSIK